MTIRDPGPLPGLVDSHCHLDFPELAPDLSDVIARARAAGVERMVTICTRLRHEPRVRAIAEANPASSTPPVPTP
jgi:TatD DNase family protein